MAGTFTCGGKQYPILHLALPRPLTALHQVELTSRCDLRCSYCPSPHLGRAKIDMTRATFLRALEWVRHFVKNGTQEELNLAGIGESVLHPELVDFVRLAREAVGPDVRILFATNGIATTEALVQALAPYGPEVYVSLHRPERALFAVELYRRHGILGGVSIDPSLNPNSWAGQMERLVPIERRDQFPCPWIRSGWGFVLSDGRISRCCLDADGSGVIGDVAAEIGSLSTEPWHRCPDCYQVLGIAGVDQRGATMNGKSLRVVA